MRLTSPPFVTGPARLDLDHAPGRLHGSETTTSIWADARFVGWILLGRRKETDGSQETHRGPRAGERVDHARRRVLPVGAP